MEYGRILRRALDIVWRHKVLWVFGIAAVLFGAGNGGNSGQGLQYSLRQGDLNRLFGSPGSPFGPNGLFGDAQALLSALLAALVVLLVVGIVVAIVSILVRYTAEGALIHGVDEIERTEGTTFASGLRRGWDRFWRLFLIEVLIGLAMIVVAIVFALLVAAGVALAAFPAIAMAEGGTSPALPIIWAIGVGLVVLLFAVLVALVVSAAVTLVREYAFRASVLDGQGVFDSFGTAFRMIRERLRESLLVWLLLLLVQLVISLLAIPVVLLGIGAVVVPFALLVGATELSWVAILVAIPLLLLVAAVAIWFGGLYYAFRSAVWTLTYRELRTTPAIVMHTA